LEDAHIIEPNFEKDTGLFSIFDGHGGSEVAKFCGNHFGEELKKNPNYINGDYVAALKETFLLMDVMLLSPDGLQEIEKMKEEAEKEKKPQTLVHNVTPPPARRTPVPRIVRESSPGKNQNPESKAEDEEPPKEEKKEEETFAGCTANVVLIKDQKIFVANAGDSRCVLMTKNRRVIPLSTDHKPEDPIELNRIQLAGGYIEDGRVNGTLNLSRAIGD